MRTRAFVGAAATAALAAATIVAGPATNAGAASTADAQTGAAQSYVVLYQPGVGGAAARAAVAAAGGTVRSSNDKVGYAIADSRASDFGLRASASPSLVGAARNRSIGHTPTGARPPREAVEKLTAERATAAASRVAPPAAEAGAAVAAEPLAGLQWDMRAIGATARGSYAVQPGSPRVLVGIIDTGVDGSHPDIRPNFDAADSRNFTTDIPAIDGPCEVPSCVDAANVDNDGHGTHVASTIGSPVNGLGIAGVAPGVTLVNIRAGQDSGFFFLQATLDALTYAGDLGVDVVNMSFFVDPWLFNCSANPADSPAEQQEQRTIRQAVQRAIDYARGKGVLPVAASGNEATDLGHPTTDDTSPDYPVGTAKHRNVTNSCLSVPTETDGVVAVNATGPSGRKAYYSNYGTEQSDVSAPGGDFYDSPDNRGDVANLVLAAYPKSLAVLNGQLNKDGTPNTPFVVRDCHGAVCGYYQYLQGTSMASPHAVGVAALVVSKYGARDTDATHKPGLTLDPRVTEGVLLGTARDHACPPGGTYSYHRVRADGTTADSTATCEGIKDRNGFYGAGIVSAIAAVS